jgi:hypothetical protein
MALIRCSFCQKRFKLKNEETLVPKHPVGLSDGDAPNCMGSGLIGKLIKDDEFDPGRDTTDEDRQWLARQKIKNK